MKNLLAFEKVSLTYYTKTNETLAIKDLSFNVNQGEFVAIIGPSGCGKTSILSLAAGLLSPSQGKITLSNLQITRPDDKIAYMLQKDHLFPWLSIEKNVRLPLKIKSKLNTENIEYANQLIEKYGLKDFKKYYPEQLSGGMRQRAALIRTLCSKPELLLLDEPFSALDYQTRLYVCEDVYKIIRNENKTALLVTHDISEAISLADKIIVLTKRPATVKSVHMIDFDKSTTPICRREDKRFSLWFEKLWGELNFEEK